MFKCFGIDIVNVFPGNRVFPDEAGMEHSKGLKSLSTKFVRFEGVRMGPRGAGS